MSNVDALSVPDDFDEWTDEDQEAWIANAIDRLFDRTDDE